MAHTSRREARQIKREGVAGRIAGGNHLVASNDEPEFGDDDWLNSNVSRASQADAGYIEQQAFLDAIRGAGL
jgi:hypothetical protein